MQNHFMLTAEANYRHSEHERRVKAVTNDGLTADPSNTWLTALRRLLARVQALSLGQLPIREAPVARLSLGAESAGD